MSLRIPETVAQRCSVKNVFLEKKETLTQVFSICISGNPSTQPYLSLFNIVSGVTQERCMQKKNCKKAAYSNPFLPDPATQFRQNLRKLKEGNCFLTIKFYLSLYETLTYKNKIQSRNKLWWKKRTYPRY